MARKKKEPNRVDDLLDELLEDCHSPEDILGESGLMKQIKKRLIERALAGELNHHLRSDGSDEEAAANSRNGSSKKTIQSEDGELDLSIPRDRNGSFEPILVPKHQRRIAGLDEKILALYARGNSTRDISAQLEELYGGAKYRQRSSATLLRASARTSKRGSPGHSTRSTQLSTSMLCM